jgi:hypothetical protein
MIVYVKESPSASLPENVITVVLIAVSSGIVVLSSEISGVLLAIDQVTLSLSFPLTKSPLLHVAVIVLVNIAPIDS